MTDGYCNNKILIMIFGNAVYLVRPPSSGYVDEQTGANAEDWQLRLQALQPAVWDALHGAVIWFHI